MATAWNAFVDWEISRESAKQSIERAATTVQNALTRQDHVADLLSQHGAIVHGEHVYWLCLGQIHRAPCASSLSLKLEDKK